MNGVERSNDGVVLKRCPFCGGEAYKKTTFPCDRDGMEVNMYIVGCEVCDIEFRVLWNEERAIELWNTRKPMEKILKRVEDESELGKLGKMEERVGRKQTVGFVSGIRCAYQIIKEEVG